MLPRQAVTITIAALGLCALTLQAQDDKIRYQAVFGGHVTVNGTSTIHDWEVKSSILGGFMELESNLPLNPQEAAQVQELKVKPKVEVKIPVRSLKSGKSSMDSVMHDAMKIDQHPTIEYKLKELKIAEKQPKSGPAVLFKSKGDLKVAGVTKSVEMPVAIQEIETGKLKITGETQVKMTDFGIDPPAPKIALGLISTGDEVTIGFEWRVAKKE